MKRKSILKALLLTVLMCCLTFALVACGGKHTVTFNYGVDGNGDGEVDVVTVEVGDGSLLEEPTDVPTREGYTFVGWGTDNGMWNFEEDTVTADITLNARWSAGDPIDPGTPGTTVYVNYELGIGAAKSDPSSVPDRWFGAPGTTIKLPPAPAADAGWEFTGWLVTGETEPRAAGSDYTVTGTVTITAQWKSVAYTQYTWQMTTPPSDSAAGVATGTPVVGGKDITVELPAFPADESYAEYPTAGKYNVETTKATCTESAKDTLYYTIPQTQTYESYYLQIKEQSLEEPATGHLYKVWTVTQQPSATEPGTATATCENCGKTIEIPLPAITGNTGPGEGKYSETVQQPLSCEQDGIFDYVYTIPASDLADGDAEDAAEGTVKELSFTVTTPATGHDYPATATWQADKFVVNCNNNCGKNYTLTITFAPGAPGDGTGEAPEMSSMAVSFDEEAMTFSFTTPESCPFTAPENQFFDGWRDGENTYGNSAKVTVPASENASITLTAQWTTEHTHSFTREPHYDIATDKVVITCAFCGEEKPYEVTGISLDDGAPSSFVVTDTAVGTEVTLPEDFTVNARGSWETDEDSGVTTAIAIPASDLTAVVKSNGYRTAVVTVSLNDTVSEDIENVTLLTQKTAGNTVDLDGFNATAAPIGSFVGEFILHFTLSDIQRGSSTWNSWLVRFDSGTFAEVREDNWVDGNFGRTSGQFAGSPVSGASASETNMDFYKTYFWTADTLDFVITRTYAEGVYTLTMVITPDANEANPHAVTLTLQEASTQNAMTVYLGGNTTQFTYSNVYAAEKGLTPESISADNVSVPYGTELNNAQITIRVTYAGSSIVDTMTEGFGRSCEDYSATTAGTYTVTLTYQGVSTTISVTVEPRVAATQIVSYTVNGDSNAFTDGNLFSSTTGAFANGAFTPSASVAVGSNPFAGIEMTENGGITLDVTIYGAHTGSGWAPIVSIVNDAGGFFSIVAEGNSGAVGVHINAFTDPTTIVDYPNIGTLQANTTTRITVSISRTGAVSLFVNGVAVSASATVTGSMVDFMNNLTGENSVFNNTIFGYREHEWWKDAFTGGIVSCTLYNGLFSAQDFVD